MFTRNSIKHKFLSTLPISVLVLSLISLTACDSNPIEQIKSLTEDKYPVANMPDEPLETPLEINIEPKRLAMTSSWSAGVKDDGTLWTWGTDGLLRETKTGQDPTPRQVEGVNDAVAVSGSGGHMLLLRKDGTVWGWGSNSHGEIDPNDDNTFIEELRQIQGIENVIDIDAGSDNSLFIVKTGKVFLLGNNEAGLAGGESITRLNSPKEIEGLDNIVKVQGHSDYILALDKNGQLFSTASTKNFLGRENPKELIMTNGLTYYPVGEVEIVEEVVDFDYSYSRVALTEDGRVWSWGSSIDGDTAQGNTNQKYKLPTRVVGLSKVIKINSNAANTNDGSLYIWGSFAFKCKSCSGTGSSMTHLTEPTKIKSNIYVDKFVHGTRNKGLVDSKGNGWFWGSNFLAQSGTGHIQEERYVLKDETLIPRKSLFNTHANK